jgi:putative addiction module component (TIGR02574 family)
LLLEEALKLPPQEREQLCEELWESLEADQTDLPPAQFEELKRRLEEHRANPNDVVSWDDIKARWRARYGWHS